MKKNRSICLQVCMLLFLSVTVFAAPNVNGVMDDSDWVGNSSAFDGYASGGQDWEVQRIGLFLEDSTLYFGLKSGFELNYHESGPTYPGDIALSFSQNGVTENFGIKYSIDDIQNQNWASLNHEYSADLELYSNATWYTRDERGNTGTETDDNPYRLSGGLFLASLDDAGAYQRQGGSIYDPDTNALEGAVSLNLLTNQLANINADLGYDLKILWTMSCGNDALEYETHIPGGGNQVPEPATFLLYGLGLIGIGAIGRKKQTKK